MTHDPGDGETGTTNGRSRGPLVAACVVAVFLRVAIAWLRRDEVLVSGNNLYVLSDLASSLAAFEGFQLHGLPNVYQHPGYPACLAAAYLLFGKTFWAVGALSAAIGALTTTIAHRFASRISPRAGAWAAFAAALYPYLAWHGTSISDTALFTLLLLGWLDSTAALAATPLRRRAVQWGLWTAAGLLTRPSLLPLLPAAAVLLWLTPTARAVLVRRVALALTVTVAAMMPWLVRNALLTGEFPLVGAHGAEAIWSANCDEAVVATDADSSYDAVAILPQYARGPLSIGQFHTRLTPHETLAARDRFSAATRTWVQANPGTFLRLVGTRFLRIWDPRFHPRRWGARELEGHSQRNLVQILAYTPLLLLAGLALARVARDPERRRFVVFSVLVLGLYSSSHAIGAGYSRVRLPLDPFLIVLAALPVSALIGRRTSD